MTHACPIDHELALRAQDIFGDKAGAEWLTTESVPLQNRRPLDLLCTPEGCSQVFALLNGIENGSID